MAHKNHDYLSNFSSLERINLPRTTRVIMLLVVTLITAGVAIAVFTPWVQTANGYGVISAVNPQDRTQAISALVPGQIQTWHVIEGQKVKKGDPIVTLADNDQRLLERLESELIAKRQEHQANLSALSTTERDLKRRKNLLSEGLVSQRDLEQTQLKLADLEAKVASTQAQLNRAEINLARQSIQTKHAPQDGTVVGLHSAGVATLVKTGETLATFIPDNIERVAVITVNGLDAPLVKTGRKVRLQFDGWPIFQVSGWPEHALGTFPGVVSFVEPIAGTDGTFKVWVVPDEGSEGWPPHQFVRLGSKVRGWVLLEEVPLGYEIWRQLNNFPPQLPADGSQ